MTPGSVAAADNPCQRGPNPTQSSVAANRGTFFWEPEGHSPFTGYNMTAWGSNRRPTAAMNGFLNV